jgi:hypothetical protein
MVRRLAAGGRWIRTIGSWSDHRLARAHTAIGSAGLVPQCQCALLLKQQEAPSELDHTAADPGVAGKLRAGTVRPARDRIGGQPPMVMRAQICRRDLPRESWTTGPVRLNPAHDASGQVDIWLNGTEIGRVFGERELRSLFFTPAKRS